MNVSKLLPITKIGATDLFFSFRCPAPAAYDGKISPGQAASLAKVVLYAMLSTTLYTTQPTHNEVQKKLHLSTAHREGLHMRIDFLYSNEQTSAFCISR
jgi:Tfp pilus assembly ATPase PilU